MSNIYQLNNRDELYDSASIWIAKLDRGLSHEEELLFKQWLNEDASHRKVLFDMARLWDNMDILTRLSYLFPAPAGQSLDSSPANKAKHNSKPRKIHYALAASLAFLLVSGIWGGVLFSSSPVPNWLLAWQGEKSADGIYDTGIGEHSTVNLPDGSQLVLNTNSLIHVKYTDETRLFYLERGEVHIEVAHDKSRPLSVIAGGKVVQAVGTAFNVEIFGDKEVELIVTDGKVLVAEHESSELFQDIKQGSLPKDSLAVSMGEKIVLGSGNEKVDKIAVSEIEANLSWRQGNLVFRGETLEQALDEIGRYTDVRFEFADDTIKQVRIAGLFKAGDIKGLLSALEQNFHIDHEKRKTSKGDKVLLKAN
ncbi:FecR family protein [Agarilytica rhodophyticola]|uniref:FecR family protein n=1 Tax=Agarilytica rhodophyticola TaxID=1737490 RepID=UPI000B345C75|nr:FecR domain-containing protein [Agarilytica rhodophyticola]